MKLSEEDIINSVSLSNDNLHSVILLRLYDDYQKYLQNRNFNIEDISMLEIRNSYDNICKKIEGNKTSSETFYNKNVDSYIENEFLILKNAISSCDKKDKDKLDEIIALITELESLLKIKISFPNALEKCISNKLKKENVKRYYKGK